MAADIYMLLGPEEGEKSTFIKRLIKNKQEESGEAPELHRHYPFESDILDIVTLLRSGSLFASYKFVILSSIESIKKPSDINLLIEYCNNPADDVTLIMISSQTRLPGKRLMNCVPEPNRRVFWELDDSRKRGWVINFFRQRSLQAAPATVDFLLEMIENNTRDLKRECMKLVSFFAPGSTISNDDIDKYVYHSRQENVFTLFEKIAARNFGGSLEILDKMVLSGDANTVAVLSGLLWQFRKVLLLKIMKNRNYQGNKLFRAAGIMGIKSRRIYVEAHKNYSLEEVRAVIVLITEFDVKFRSFRQDMHTMLLQLFLYYTIVNGGNVPVAEESRWI